MEKKLERSPEQKRQEMKKIYLKSLIFFRDNFINDLPPERLLPGNKNYNKHKCRGNFFVGVSGYISRLINKEVITAPQEIDRGNEFINYVENRDWKRFSTKEDIDKVNEILDYMIKILS